MERHGWRVGLVALMCAAGAASLIGAPPPSQVATTATFVDVGQQIRGDNLGPYTEGSNCVRSWFLPTNGSYYFRTTSSSTCEFPPPSPRHLILDFSALPIDGQPSNCLVPDGHGDELNLCGSNSVPDVRLFADTMFKTGSVDTPVYLHFDLYPNFVNDTAFSLRFLNPAPIVQTAGGGRQITILNGEAELSVRQAGKGGKSRLVPVARYLMSMSLTVTPNP
jgi:hypothetical protein